MPVRTGNSSTPVIMTNSGTQGRTKLPENTPVRNEARSSSNRATNGSQQWEKTTRKQAMTRSRSIQPICSLFISIPFRGFRRPKTLRRPVDTNIAFPAKKQSPKALFPRTFPPPPAETTSRGTAFGSGRTAHGDARKPTGPLPDRAGQTAERRGIFRRGVAPFGHSSYF